QFEGTDRKATPLPPTPTPSPTPTPKAADATPVKQPDPPTPTPPPPPPEPPTPTPTPEPPVIEKITKIAWYWPCGNNPDSKDIPTSTDKLSPVLIGEGDHELKLENMPDEIPLAFSGKICPSESLERDIVFVIDASGSMYENDRIQSDQTCGRYNAVNAILTKNASSTKVKFAVVTFATAVRYQSTTFYSDGTQLMDSIKTGQNVTHPGVVLCNGESGNTHYDEALSAAKTLLSSGRSGATKEIYFISDGLPDSGQEGIDIATDMKTKGITIGSSTIPVTIATIMLIGNDNILANQIASKDSNGKPIHSNVQDAAQLADSLIKLSERKIVSAKVSYGFKADALTDLDALKNTTGTDFSIPVVELNKVEADEGIFANYSYVDSFGSTFTFKGKIVFTETKN
ncbi:MAG: VWA domain-containing protein, partial [Oligoflexales bacterium]|nr:VWA domain-containing protein [Oligoflexales bacterium]